MGVDGILDVSLEVEIEENDECSLFGLIEWNKGCLFVLEIVDNVYDSFKEKLFVGFD